MPASSPTLSMILYEVKTVVHGYALDDACFSITSLLNMNVTPFEYTYLLALVCVLS